jgi:hypothetical protein
MSKKVPVQKGPIDPNVPTMKFMSPQERAREDAENQAMRRKGQAMEFVSPFKKI